MFECIACNKSYTTKTNLKLHHTRQPLCINWIKLNPGLKDYIDTKYNLPEDPHNIQTQQNTTCGICNTTFSNIGNLNKHLNTSIICSKWKHYKELQPLETYISKINYNEIIPVDKPYYLHKESYLLQNIKTSPSIYHEEFIAPKHKLCHIIWNIFLIDKEFAISEDLLEDNNIKYIISILPDEETYNNKFSQYNIDHYVMKYNGHNTNIDINEYDIQCNKIEDYRSRRENIFVFCNNGYQRSIPFLCYYLVKYHNNEAPTIEKALDLILPQVDKANYITIKDNYIEKMKLLLTPYIV